MKIVTFEKLAYETDNRLLDRITQWQCMIMGLVGGWDIYLSIYLTENKTIVHDSNTAQHMNSQVSESGRGQWTASNVSPSESNSKKNITY